MNVEDTVYGLVIKGCGDALKVPQLWEKQQVPLHRDPTKLELQTLMTSFVEAEHCRNYKVTSIIDKTLPPEECSNHNDNDEKCKNLFHIGVT